jgi:hypothetical protein
MICSANSRNCLLDDFCLAIIRNYSTENNVIFTRNIGNTMTDSSGAKEYEDVMQKVGIWLGKRLMIEEEINVDEKPTDEQPHNDVVSPAVVVPTSYSNTTRPISLIIFEF